MTHTRAPNIPFFDGEEILAGISRWVEIETPSQDDAAVNRLVDIVESDLARIAARTARTHGRDGYGDILEAQAYVLVMEPARDGGKCVTARKGWGRFEMTITGRASHAGLRPQDGRSAVSELAQQILDLEAMTDYDIGTTVVMGTVRGGSAPNVVPSEACASIDLRVPPSVDASDVVQRILQRKPHAPDCAVAVTGDINRPAYSKSAGIAALFEHAQVCAAEVGFALDDAPLTGGVSDGNFTAALGISTLDGLGADGHGAHAPDEQIKFSSLVPRVQLLVRLMETLR